MATETKATHTPGPWHADIACGDIRVAANGGQFLARVYPLLGDDSERDRATENANARLMAAAPDLLAALRLCRAIIGCGSKGARLRAEPEAIAKAEAAIAKAETR